MGETKAILVVDDDPVVRRVVVRVLAGPYDVTEAEGGREALVKIMSSGFDLVVSDVDMPDGDGPSLLEAAESRGILPMSSFVFMSGGSETGARISSLVKKGIVVLRKPFLPSELLSAVRSAIDAAPKSG